MIRSPDVPITAVASPRLRWLIVLVTFLKAIVTVRVFQHPRVWEDGAMAGNFLQTGTLFFRHYGVDNHSFQFPVYAFMVATVYRLFGVRPALIGFLNLFLNALNAWVLMHLFWRLFDRLQIPVQVRPHKESIVTVAILGFLLHPLISYYSMNNVHPFALDMLMLYVPILLALRYFDRGEGARDFVILGLSLGAALLTRTVLVVSILPFVIIARAAWGWKTALSRTGLLLGIAALVGAPWLIRNYRMDRIFGYTSTAGEILWKGSLKGSDGSNFLSDGRPYVAALSDSERASLETLSVSGQNHFFMGKYREAVMESPLQVARLFFVKLKNFFWFRALIGNDYGPAIRRLIPIYRFAYALILVLAMLSIPLIGRSSWLVWSVVIGLGMFQSVFYVETRHRVVIEPLLMFLATLSSAVLLSQNASRRAD
jgi:hypothetical protein